MRHLHSVIKLLKVSLLPVTQNYNLVVKMSQQAIQQPNNGIGLVVQSSPMVQITPPDGFSQPSQCKLNVIRGLGIPQIIIGSLCILSNIATLSNLGSFPSLICHGIWGGITVSFILRLFGFENLIWQTYFRLMEVNDNLSFSRNNFFL